MTTRISAETDLGLAAARLLLQSGALQVSHDRPFVLAAGWASPVYIDVRRLIDAPGPRREMIALALESLTRRFGGNLPFDAVAGGETAGIAWAAWLADGLGLKLRYVRKRPLGIGRHSQVEGGDASGLKVLLIDDLATDAASKAAFVRGLRHAGASVSDCFVIFYHGVFPGSAERLASLGLAMHALATWKDMLRLSSQESLLSPLDRDVIETFLQDPAAWSAAHGGRTVA